MSPAGGNHHISALGSFIKAFDFTGAYQTRTPSIQGGFQAAGIVVSLLMAFAGGAIVGKAEGSTERGGSSQPGTAPSTVPGLLGEPASTSPSPCPPPCPLLAGGILKLPIWGDAAAENCFEDGVYWEVRGAGWGARDGAVGPRPARGSGGSAAGARGRGERCVPHAQPRQTRLALSRGSP